MTYHSSMPYYAPGQRRRKHRIRVGGTAAAQWTLTSKLPVTVTLGKAGRSKHGRIGSRPGGEFRTTWARDRSYSNSAARPGRRARAQRPGQWLGVALILRVASWPMIMALPAYSASGATSPSRRLTTQSKTCGRGELRAVLVEPGQPSRNPTDWIADWSRQDGGPSESMTGHGGASGSE